MRQEIRVAIRRRCVSFQSSYEVSIIYAEIVGARGEVARESGLGVQCGEQHVTSDDRMFLFVCLSQYFKELVFAEYVHVCF